MQIKNGAAVFYHGSILDAHGAAVVVDFCFCDYCDLYEKTFYELVVESGDTLVHVSSGSFTLANGSSVVP